MVIKKHANIRFCQVQVLGAMGQSTLVSLTVPEILANSYFRDELQEAPLLALDLETTGLDPRKDDLLLITLAVPERSFTFAPDQWPAIEPLFDDRNRRWLIHHAPFDLGFVYAKFGLQLFADQIWDTRLVEKFVRPKENPSLSPTVTRYFGIGFDKTQQQSFVDHQKGRPFTADQLEYASLDALILHPLQQQQAFLIKNATNIQHLLADNLHQTYVALDSATAPIPNTR
jgi:ribonuclease D